MWKDNINVFLKQNVTSRYPSKADITLSWGLFFTLSNFSWKKQSLKSNPLDHPHPPPTPTPAQPEARRVTRWSITERLDEETWCINSTANTQSMGRKHSHLHCRGALKHNARWSAGRTSRHKWKEKDGEEGVDWQRGYGGLEGRGGLMEWSSWLK